MYPYLIAIGKSKIKNEKKFPRHVRQLFGTKYLLSNVVIELSS